MISTYMISIKDNDIDLSTRIENTLEKELKMEVNVELGRCENV